MKIMIIDDPSNMPNSLNLSEGVICPVHMNAYRDIDERPMDGLNVALEPSPIVEWFEFKTISRGLTIPFTRKSMKYKNPKISNKVMKPLKL